MSEPKKNAHLTVMDVHQLIALIDSYMVLLVKGGAGKRRIDRLQKLKDKLDSVKWRSWE